MTAQLPASQASRQASQPSLFTGISSFFRRADTSFRLGDTSTARQHTVMPQPASRAPPRCKDDDAPAHWPFTLTTHSNPSLSPRRSPAAALEVPGVRSHLSTMMGKTRRLQQPIVHANRPAGIYPWLLPCADGRGGVALGLLRGERAIFWGRQKARWRRDLPRCRPQRPCRIAWARVS